jgi:two-component system cell cycle sensor histidine kinase/response regulator CckA
MKKEGGSSGDRRRKVLIMDDDDVFCKFMRRVLDRLGYDVGIAGDGAAAVELYRKSLESGDPFDAVIVDLKILGGMGGEEAIKRLLKADPNVKAIASSGYSNDPVIANYKEYGFRDAIAKPYTMEELANTLDRILKEA